MAVRVRVDGTDRVFMAGPGDDLLEVFQSGGEPIATACGGVAFCGTCDVTVVAGGDALVDLRAQELLHLGPAASASGRRLACQARVRPDADGEVVVSIPARGE